MALDHYVPQVHLKRFNAPTLNGKKMYAKRKADGHAFICGSKDVCRLQEGSTNAYLSEPRLIEQFLKLVEPNYNRACTALAEGPIKPDAVFAIAGFVASILACSPAAARLGTAPLEELVKVEAAVLDRMGELPKAPPELGGKTLSELLAEGAVRIETDSKFPQANGILAVLDLAKSFGNFHWDILINEHPDVPFFTSDFPVAVEATPDPRIVNRVVPLTPFLAIRICPNLELAKRKLEPTFQHFSYSRLRPSRSQIVAVNRMIVRSAEDLVFSSVDAPWVGPFVEKNARFRLENETANRPWGTGYLSITRTVVRERNVSDSVSRK